MTSAGRNEDPTWAPDGRHIAFVSDRSGVRQLWVLDVETGRVRQLQTRCRPAPFVVPPTGPDRGRLPTHELGVMMRASSLLMLLADRRSCRRLRGKEATGAARARAHARARASADPAAVMTARSGIVSRRSAWREKPRNVLGPSPPISRP